MKNLFDVHTSDQVKERIAHLSPESAGLWGKMNAAQAVAHCSAGLELALGDKVPPRLLWDGSSGRSLNQWYWEATNPCVAIRPR